MNSLQSFGVDCSEVIYGEGRLGSYYLEVGAGLRASNVIYDRKYSTISLMKENEWMLDELFNGVSIFHLTGITLALSPAWEEIGLHLIKEAKNRGIMISFDMNYRAKMWSYKEAVLVYQKVLPFVDYLSAGKLDAIHFLDIPEVDGKEDLYYLNKIAEKYSNLSYIFGTTRTLMTPNNYKLKGYILDAKEIETAVSKEYNIVQVIDRVGSGDAYGAGILDGIIKDKDLSVTVEFAMAASSLKHTINGDVNLFSREEIEHFRENMSDISR